MRDSKESEPSGWTGRCFRVKVNLPTFKDKGLKTQCLTAHGDGMCLYFAALVGMTATCCPIFLGLCKDSW